MTKARTPLFLLAVLALLAGMWAGLLRIGWPFPLVRPAMPTLHGPLMISGFLGTLICLERAIAAGQRWAYGAALCSGLGTLLLLLGVGGGAGIFLFILAGAGLLLLFVLNLRQHFELHTVIMMLGALLWLVGNILWASGRPMHLVVWWWAGFLILTIAGERLELSRVLRLPRWVKWLFLAATAVNIGGLILTLFNYDRGLRLNGAGMILLAAWLLVFDLARRNLRKPGLTGYIAACLFSGYVWLGVGGLLALGNGAVSAGPIYDAILHAIFLGFVFGMIFGHAPIIFPAVLDRPLPYRPSFYLHLVLLQITLIMRIAGDLFSAPLLRQWGGLFNALVLLIFLANMVWSLLQGGKQPPAKKPLPEAISRSPSA
jgi:hypothetical protein